MLAIHSASRDLVDRAVLRPLALRTVGAAGAVEAGDATEDGAAGAPKHDLAALNGLGLVVGRPPEPIALREVTPDRGAFADLMGIARKDGPRIDEARRAVAHRRWSPSDVPPILVLGSTVGLPFTLERSAGEAAQDFAEPLARALEPYVQLLEGDADRRLDLTADVAAMNRLTREAERSAAVHLSELDHDDRKMALLLIGQAGRRQRMADGLAVALPDPEERRAHLARLLGCGLLHAMTAARAVLKSEVPGEDGLRDALRALRSAGRLATEM